MVKRKRANKKSGQTALIVMLFMVIILTISLSLVSRSITDIRISQDEKEALRAFSAAEAGIEEALKQNLVAGSQIIDVGVGPNDLDANVTVEEKKEGAIRTIERGETSSFILTDLPATTLQIYWIDRSKTDETSTLASIEVTIFYNNSNFTRFAYNANGNPLRNDFAVGINGGTTYHSRANISVLANAVLAKITTFYNKATVMVQSSNSGLPAQQYEISSKAVAEGEKISGIEVSRTVAILPPIFDYALFTTGSLSN